MKEYPILFNGEMVRAILDGRKTQTRRIKTKYGVRKLDFIYDPDNKYPFNIRDRYALWNGYKTMAELAMKHCPYGAPGDRLWVRETWQAINSEGCKPRDITPNKPKLLFKASGGQYHRWRPSIFMPRWASRILLEITNVRVERINDISINDVYFEGTDIINGWDSDDVIFAKFIELWDSINAKRGFSWESNPWVWVIEFKVLEPSHAE